MLQIKNKRRYFSCELSTFSFALGHLFICAGVVHIDSPFTTQRKEKGEPTEDWQSNVAVTLPARLHKVAN
jgi:hypothetical protein